ncbi:MAG: creatininase family protein, partial [Pseudomonadota bacterium]
AGEAFNQHLEDQPHLMHACEGETSMMMALVPDLVDTSDLAGIAVPRGKGALKAGNASYRWRSFTAVTANGISGDPTRSNPDKGEKLLEAAGQCLADLITDPETWAPAPDMRGREIDGVPFRDK